MERLKPFVQSDMAALHRRFRCDREILPAFLFGAAIPTDRGRFIGMTDHAAVRANRTSGPAEPL